MNKLFKRFNTKPIVAIAVALMVFVLGKKGYEYAAEPRGEKDCSPLLPDLAQSEAKELRADVDLAWSQIGGFVNDASCLSKTAIYGALSVKAEDDIKEALRFARESDIKVSIAGVKHSMGGQAFYKSAILLDMKGFNKMSLDEERKVLRVQSGATWHDIQNFLHPKFAVKAMQSTDIFTVGGSISVNAHGMDHNAGSVAQTVRSMRVLLPSGEIVVASRDKNKELFNLVLGGYGLFGIVLDAELDVTDNVVYKSERAIIDYADFENEFKNNLSGDKNIGLFYGHLSTAPGRSFLREMILYKYRLHEESGIDIPPLGEVGSVKLRRFIFNFAKLGSIPMRIKWFAEKHIEPMLESCPVSRAQAMGEGEACLVSRNEPMHDSVPYLRNRIKNDTDILHEYFVPRESFTDFVDGMRDILKKNKTNLLNASVRVVHKEENFLNYAPKDAFAVVLYINQKTDERGNEKMKKVTQELINLATEYGGRFFLPYQLHYTREQLKENYPEIDEFFRLKKKYDPKSLLTNTFYERYKF